MAGWEVALLMIAFTYLMVNTAYMVVSLKFMTKVERLFDRSMKICEKMFDAAEESFDDQFEQNLRKREYPTGYSLFVFIQNGGFYGRNAIEVTNKIYEKPSSKTYH